MSGHPVSIKEFLYPRKLVSHWLVQPISSFSCSYRSYPSTQYWPTDSCEISFSKNRRLQSRLSVPASGRRQSPPPRHHLQGGSGGTDICLWGCFRRRRYYFERRRSRVIGLIPRFVIMNLCPLATLFSHIVRPMSLDSFTFCSQWRTFWLPVWYSRYSKDALAVAGVCTVIVWLSTVYLEKTKRYE